MGLISSQFGVDSESSLFNWFGGIGKAILGGQNGKFHLRNRYNQLSQYPQKVSLIDISFGELMSIALNVPHLNIIISKKAEMFSNMTVRHVDKNGDDIKNSDILKLLDKPNPLQTWQEFIYEFSVLDSIYSNNFIYKNKSAIDALPRVLFCLPSSAMKINLTGKIYRQNSLEGIIESYKLMFDDVPFLPNEIIQISQGIKPNMISANSRIESHQMPLSNIVACLKAFNQITTEKGANGLIVSDLKGSTNNSLPFDEKEQSRVNKHYKDTHSLDSEGGSIIVSTNQLKFIPITIPVKDLMTFEGMEDAFGNLCDGWGMHRQIFSDSFVHTKTLGGKMELDGGLKFTYQNTLMPQATVLLNNFASDFGLAERGEKLIPVFDLPCMGADNLNEAQADQAENTGMQIAVQTIVTLNTAIKSGNITTDAAIKLLTLQGEYTEEEAQSVLIEQPVIVEPDPNAIPPNNNFPPKK